jgi:hypothetical protein
MYWGYNLLDGTLPNVNTKKQSYGYQKIKFKFEKDMFEIAGNVISGTVLQKNWFPKVDADVFISHSHIDKPKAEKLAIWLEECFGLTSFIDSFSWGYKDDLIKSVIKKLNKPSINIIDVIKISDHITTILQGAIVNLMIKTDCFIFINTKNSINVSLLTHEESITYSPWLYFELLLAKSIEKRRMRYRNVQIKDSKSHDSFKKVLDIPNIEHKAHIEDLKTINYDVLKLWMNSRKSANEGDPLVTLEKIVHSKAK